MTFVHLGIYSVLEICYARSINAAYEARASGIGFLHSRYPVASPKSFVVISLVVLLTMVAVPVPLQAQSPSNEPLADRCFAVSDESGGDTADSLFEVDLDVGVVPPPRRIDGGGRIEAIALVPDSQSTTPPAGREYDGFTMYAANEGTFGWLNFDPDNVDTPVRFIRLGNFTDDGRKARGSDNTRSLNDVDSLTFDSVNNIMYGVHRRFFDSDLLFQIDMNTGHFIDDVFAGGNDYVEVEFREPLHDVDDIAIHPINRKMYAVINNRGVSGLLIEIDPATGSKVGEWQIHDSDNGLTVNDIEGLAFSSTLQLYGTTGEHGPSGGDQNQLYRIDLPELGTTTGTVMATSVAPFDSSADDVEGLGCLTSVSAGPKIDVEKATNGLDADEPSPNPDLVPQLARGCPVTWTYTVTNISDANPPITLTNITLVDEKIFPANDGTTPATIQCPLDTLAQGESMVCSAVHGEATETRHGNTATVTADAVGSDAKAFDTDDSWYYAYTTSIQIEKSTNGQDADEAPGPQLTLGDPVSWEYVVTNTGDPLDPILTDITVTDDMLVDGDISCPTDTLNPGMSMTCTATGVAAAGQYRNVATVSARLAMDPNGSCQITDTDPSHYLGVGNPSITVEKLTSGCGAALPVDSPQLIADWPVIWTYRVINDGQIALSDIFLVDDQFGPITCPSTTLDAGTEMTCSAEGTATVGNYSNLATVTALSNAGPVSAQDTSQYTGVQASLQIEKSTNGQDSDVAPGQMIPEGAPVAWTYLVTNNGAIGVRELRVVDDQLAEGEIDCGGVQTLAPGESVTCTASGVAIAGPYENLATAIAVADVADEASCAINSSDSSHYEGVGDLIIGQSSIVSWTYAITNTGDVPLNSVTLDGGPGVIVPNKCRDVILPNGVSLECGVQGSEESFGNTATVTAIDSSSNTQLTVTIPGPQLDGLSMDVLFDDPIADADEIPKLLLDSQVPLRFVVSNQGALPVEDIAVEMIDLNTGIRQPLTCQDNALATGASTNCQTTTSVLEGQNGIIGTVTGKLAGTGQPLYADGSRFYEGMAYATIGGRLFIDNLNAFGNANGLQDLGESSLSSPNVQIELYSADSNQPLQTATIDNTGTYTFENVWPGEYYLVALRPSIAGFAIEPPATTLSFQGFIWTVPNRINNRADSDVDPALAPAADTARTESIQLESGEVDMSWDIGFKQLAFNGLAFIDEDNDRQYDYGETVISGATVSISDQLNPGGQATEVATSTDGTYALSTTPGIHEISAAREGYRFEPVASPGGTTINFIASPALESGIYLPIITSPVASGGK